MLLKASYPDAIWYDLLKTDVYVQLLEKPSILRGQPQVALVHYALAIGMGILALIVSQLNIVHAYVVLSFLVVVGILAIVWLEQLPFEHQE